MLACPTCLPTQAFPDTVARDDPVPKMIVPVSWRLDPAFCEAVRTAARATGLLSEVSICPPAAPNPAM